MKDKLFEKLPHVIIPWYRENARDLPWRKTREPYPIWLSEIMLQQTRVEAVKGYYHRFLSELPTIEALAKADENRLLKLWEGLGYYNRARNLQKAAQIIVSENNGVFPSEYSEILCLPGIGEYTAGAIASNCFDEPVAAVDGNVLRVVSRITEDYDDILKASTKKKVKQALEAVYPRKNCGDFTQGLMEIGAIVCLPNGQPKCEICPAQEFCIARKEGRQLDLPVKAKKKERRIEYKTVFMLMRDGKFAIRQREKKGLLAGLWEFPNISGIHSLPQAAKRMEKDWGLTMTQVEKKLERSHIFTHVEWKMNCYYFTCTGDCEQFSWVSEEEILKAVTLPTAFRQFWENR